MRVWDGDCLVVMAADVSRINVFTVHRRLSGGWWYNKLYDMSYLLWEEEFTPAFISRRVQR